MEREVFNKYPDYLQNFEHIAVLTDWQWSVISAYCIQIGIMLESVKLEDVGLSGDYWNKFVDVPPGLRIGDALIKLHQRYAVTTLDVLKSYISCWIDEDSFTAEYDNETMTITLRVGKSTYYKEFYNQIRDVIPCNLMLVIEVT